jgi:hypothetical protein
MHESSSRAQTCLLRSGLLPETLRFGSFVGAALWENKMCHMDYSHLSILKLYANYTFISDDPFPGSPKPCLNSFFN